MPELCGTGIPEGVGRRRDTDRVAAIPEVKLECANTANDPRDVELMRGLMVDK